MTQLTVGKFKLSEIAEWFGIKVTSFNAAKEKKLEELKEFADYELVSSHQILITKVKYPFYVKRNSKNYEIIKKQITKTWNPDGIDTCKRVSNQIYREKHNELTLTESTTYNYTKKAKNELYGKCGSKYGGSIGYSNYIWAKWDHEHQKYVKLSPEEDKIKKQLFTKYFGKANEVTMFIQESIKNGELTKEEAWEAYDEMMDIDYNFKNVLDDFFIQTGIKLVRCTIVTGKDWEEIVEA